MAASPEPSPSDVGQRFVHTYYAMLKGGASQLHRFYGQSSQFVHAEYGEKVAAIHGQAAIRDRIAELGLEEVDVSLDSASVDCQASLSGAVHVMVLGRLSIKRGPARQFAQAFLLAPLDISKHSYYVLNNVFRFCEPLSTVASAVEKREMMEPAALATTSSHCAAPVSVSTAPALTVAAAGASEALTSAVTATTTATATTSPVVVPTSAPGPAATTPAATAVAVRAAASAAEIAAAPDAAAGPASAAAGAAAAAGPVAPVAQAARAAVAAPAAARPQPRSWSSVVTEAARSGMESRPVPVTAAASGAEAKAPARSAATTVMPSGTESTRHLFVRGLIPGVREEDIGDAFGAFGRIVHIDMSHVMKAFAFLEFETQEAADRALAAPVSVMGKIVDVQRRRPPNRSTRGAPPPGKGRAGSSSR